MREVGRICRHPLAIILCCGLALFLAALLPVVVAFHAPLQSRRTRAANVVIFTLGNGAEVDTERTDCHTTAILKVAYDGTHFRGSSGQSVSKQTASNRPQPSQPAQPTQRRQSRRSRTLQRKGGYYGSKGSVRTVEDTLRSALAKLYGNVDPKQIEINSCSRTDAGVHATTLITQFYCSSDATLRCDDTEEGSVSGSMPRRPRTGDDASYLPLPFDSDLPKLVFVLNRMLPPDLRVVAASPLPPAPLQIPPKGDLVVDPESGQMTFHPTLHAASKTYAYQFAVGPVHDPLQTQYVWHLDGSSANAVGMNWKRFDLERALRAADLFVDSNPRDYGAFRSAFRGTDRGRIQSTLCKIWRCEIVPERRERVPSWDKDAMDASKESNDIASEERHMRYGGRLNKSNLGELVGLNASPKKFTVVVTGDRFLYKMVRNIVGTIVAVGCGHLELEDVRTALDTGSWGGRQRGKDDLDVGDVSVDADGTIRRICAPARGLTLVNVKYPEEIHFSWQSG